MFSYCLTTKQRGYTLVEILLALGISTVMMLSLSAVMQNFAIKTAENKEQTSYRLDMAVLERQLFQDLSGSGPSLGNLLTKTPGQRAFFEFFGDISSQRLPAAVRSREYVVDPKAGLSSFEFISEYKTGGDRRYFNPADAYETKIDLEKPSPLTYFGVNHKGFMDTFYKDHFKAKGHFFFFAPAAVQAYGGSLDGIAPVRFYSFLGYSNLQDIVPDLLGGLFDNSHPFIAGSLVNDIDRYLRLQPPLGGSMSQVLVLPVRIIKYELKLNENSKLNELWRSYRVGVDYSRPEMVGEGIDKVIFTRPDVTNRRVDFQIVITKRKVVK